MKKPGSTPAYPPLAIVRLTEGLRRFFLRANLRLTDPQVVMWERVQQLWLAAGIGVAARLGLADLLSSGTRSIDELARLTSTHEASLYRLMRMLASHGIFREKPEGMFSTTRMARPLEDGQIRNLVMVHLDPAHFRMFSELMEVVKSGKTLKTEGNGRDLFDHIASDAGRNEAFNRAMSDASRMQIPALIPAFPFGKFGKIIDLGGGRGMFLAAILRKYSGSRGLVYDLAQALENMKDYISSQGLEGRMETEAGDFFVAVPSGGDLYIMKSVLHDWDDEEAIQILERVNESMGKEATLLVIETVLDEGNEPSMGKMTDLLMMVSAGGRERTRSQYETLLGRAGFGIRKIHPTITPLSLIEAGKI